MGKSLLPPGEGDDDGVEPVDLKKALEERYLAYALSTIMHRALPDVRDGLKPVHRRIMHAMRLLRLNPDQGFAKCARIVGEVMGKFHPHGDQSIYDALVRLAQPFAMRYPLVDGQGNFGNIDGDNAAAMRYTEARMTEVATLLLEGITEDAVDFRPTYNDEDREPAVLPGAFPNLLANGSSGIAVGMATSIPPHNVAELCAAAVALIDDPEAPVARLLDFVKGPDFPTGGILVESAASMREAYETGRGGFRLRARWNREDQGRGTWNAVVTEIPYGVQKARLIEKIAELILARRLPLVDDIRDESAEDVRIVLVPKSRAVDPDLMMESLFRLTELETRFPLNMNVLSHGRVPGVQSLKGVLREWLDHRREVLLRRSRHRLAEIERRLEILSGYLIAYLNIDEVIRIIREEDEPKPVMMARFSLTDTQAEAILNMRLRALRKLEEFEIRKEFDALSEEKTQIEGLLGSEARQWKTVRWEIAKVGDRFSAEGDPLLGPRRTTFGAAPAHDIEDVQQALVEREPITVVVSQKGWLRALKGHLGDFSTLAFKEGDALKCAFHAQTTDKVLLFTTGGKVYTLGADRLPGGRGHGEPVRLMVDMDNDQAIVTAFAHDPERRRLVVSHAGNGFVVAEKDVVANTRKGKQVMNVRAPDEAAFCVPVSGDHVAIVGQNRKLLVFPLSEVPEMTRGKGVRLQRYRDGGVSDVKTFALEEGLTWQDSAERTHSRSAAELAEWRATRATAGRMAPKGFPRTGKFG
ncbi:DNA topoisomerase IV subunit A [Aquibium sp. A9E412]|uniref:DNA topoisomerase IV subunit A n=1 Tax=Aquibium sp. A9E412 TaxID=2976767 RepID=UPI0025AFE006|nr:DNA topoisomerase IV subunit A [Aquibium sp. A9E412]MDN2564971.1 DNA topoisomerase IV subunit A [Aquibium sp. A9E412]